MPAITTEVQSITRAARHEPFELQVSRGQIGFHTPVRLYASGYTNASSTFTALWEGTVASGNGGLGTGGTEYVFPTSAQQMFLQSTGSTGGDVGAVITITGLSSSYAPLTENIVLNGQTSVTTVNSYFRINNINVSNLNSAKQNPAGVITLSQTNATTNGAPNAGNTVYAQINTDVVNGTTSSIGTSQMLVYTVPANNTYYLARVSAWSSSASAQYYTTYRVVQNLSNGVQRLTTQTPFVFDYTITRVYPNVYTAGTDIRWEFGYSSNTSISVGASVEGVLISTVVQ